MDIIQDKIDHLNSVLTVKINPDDYLARVEKAIKEQAKKVKMPGFRPGMVPTSHVKRMYGKEILVDEINKILNDTLTNYIEENKLAVLGQPLPKLDNTKEFNWDFKDEFEFAYEMGLAPEVTAEFSSKDRLKHYTIKADNDILASRITNLRKAYGKRTNPQVSADEDVLLVDLAQLSPDGTVFEDGITATSSMRLDKIQDAEIKKNLIGLSNDSVVTIDLAKAYADDKSALAKLLNISEEDAQGLKSQFKLTVKNINRLEESDLDQAFFDKLFEKDTVKTQEEFEAKVRAEVESMMVQNAEQKLQFDLYTLGLEKFNAAMPDAFLKRWLKATNEKISDQELEEGYPDFEKRLKWTLIENKIIKENNIEIKYEEVFQAAKERLAAQFKMYSPGVLPEEQLVQYTNTFLKDKNNANQTFEEVKAKRVFDYLKNVVTLDKVEITNTEFGKLA